MAWLVVVVAVLFTLVFAYGTFTAQGDAAAKNAVYVSAIALLLGLPGALASARQVADGRGPTSRAVVDDTLDRLTAELAATENVSAVDIRGVGDDLPRIKPVDLQIEPWTSADELAGTPTGGSSRIADYYLKLATGRLVVLGDGGSGKTVLTTTLTQQLLDRLDAGPAESNDRGPALVPIRLAAEHLPQAASLEDWVVADVLARVPLNPQALRKLVHDGRLLPIVDGLDEFDEPGSGNVYAQQALRLLNDWERRGRLGGVVVTCRTDRYDDLPAFLHEAHRVTIRRLSVDQIDAFVVANTQLGYTDAELTWLSVLDCLRIGGAEADSLYETLSSPLFLSLALIVCRETKDPNQLFFRDAATAAGPRVRPPKEIRDSLLASFLPASLAQLRRRDGLRPDDSFNQSVLRFFRLNGVDPYSDEFVLRVLTRVATLTGVDGSAAATIDLARWPDVITTRPDRPNPASRRRLLRLVQGGLAGLAAIVAVAMLAFGQPGGWSGLRRLIHHLGQIDHLSLSYAICLMVASAGAISLPIAAAIRCSDPFVEPKRLALPTAFPRVAGLLLAVFGAAGLALGLAIGTVFVSIGFATDVRVLLTIAAAGGLVAGLGMGMVLPTRLHLPVMRRPSDVIRLDALSGAVAAVSMGGISGFFGLVAAGLGFGLAAGSAVLVATFLCLSPRASVAYLLAILMNHRHAGLPLRWAHFLDHCLDAGLLRVVGTSYHFRHADFAEWLKAGHAPD